MTTHTGRLLAALFTTVVAASAGTINFQSGNPTPGSNEVLVHFSNDLIGLSVSGNAGLDVVTFQTDNPLDLIESHPGNGLAFITGANGGNVLAPITVSLPLGITFGDISFNLQCGQNCAPVPSGSLLTFNATFADGTSAALTRAFSNGENRYTAYAVGSAFTSVTFGATVPYSQAEQIKLSEIAGPNVNTPEPGTIGLAGAGLTVAALLGRRKRRA